jgi:uncharacterized OB-fold protein
VSRLEPQPAGIPVPTPSRVSATFWDGCRVGELRFQRCRACAAPVFNPSTICGACGGRALRWEVSRGHGRLYSWTVVWRPQTPAFRTPYAPAIVELEEGFYLLSANIGCAPGDLVADMPVVVDFHPAGDDIVLPYFRPSSPAAAPT